MSIADDIVEEPTPFQSSCDIFKFWNCKVTQKTLQQVEFEHALLARMQAAKEEEVIIQSEIKRVVCFRLDAHSSSEARQFQI